jgi:hypothetical protein
MTIDQMADFLTDAFPEISRETLFLILQSHRYNLEKTLEVLIQMESEGGGKSSQLEASEGITNSSDQQKQSGKSDEKKARVRRGAQVSLPDDFLRVPGFNEKRQEYVETGSLVNLLADPLFLQELEREFGPNYQSVLREHLQAEALRNTTDRAPYSGHPAPPPCAAQQVINHPNAPREFYVQSSPSLPSQRANPPLVPFTTQYYNQTPPPYAHANINVGQQQPAVLAHQSSSSHSPSFTSSATSSASSSWFTSPFSSSQTTASTPPATSSSSDQSRQPLIGFGGGDPPPPRDQDGPSSKSP